jgi:hypothetical protein
MNLCVLTHCMQCLNVAVIAWFTSFLELYNIHSNAIERATGFVRTRTTDVFLHLALDAWNAICLLITLTVGAYLETSSRVLKMLKSLVAWVAKQLMGLYSSNSFRRLLLTAMLRSL